MSKRLDAGALLSDGRARTQRPPAEPAPRGGGTYRNLNIFVTTEQHQWAKNMARNLTDGDVGCTMADLFRLAIDQLAEKPVEQIAVEWARHANAEAKRYPGRLTRKLPPDPDEE